MFTVLFACTGNTCRSPIAAAVARHYVRLHGLPVRVLSAGIHARDGDAITPEAEVALAQIGITDSHASQGLTRELLESCDLVFVMETWQGEAIAEKILQWSLETPPDVMMLDPEGNIVDPLGNGQQVYNELTHKMLGLIPNRLGAISEQFEPEAQSRG
ncbi:hypothetical protein [Thalassospira sp.]|uniref:arsenate reductase/protein-tyrosine-phosphatase family protein n=1 Tax=Thalassospira sp. TaxID=1912094 RepID=UPI000C5939E0|nr:hypothetical protein [Thalassospira sp.]MBC06225.1 hypothetical protein [Thalassospira sp.]|tara:strand:- start:5 stop:478 length:474 start_codon:yes stop_codon:yes gene_type:complete